MVSKLEFRLINYFLLIAFAAILIGIEFYFEMDSAHGKDICNIPEQQSFSSGIPEGNPLEDLRNKILIMFMLLSIVVAIVLTMFIKNITNPISKMVIVSRSINDGDLSQTIVIDQHDEIAEVGEAINELASNLQEIATFTSVTANESLEIIKKLELPAKDNAEIQQIKNDLEKNIKSISGFVSSFKLLDTNL